MRHVLVADTELMECSCSPARRCWSTVWALLVEAFSMARWNLFCLLQAPWLSCFSL